MRLSVLLLSFIGAAGLALAASHPRIARDLEGLDPDSTVDVIVQYRQVPTRDHISRAKQHGGRHSRTLELVNGAVFSMSPRGLADLANDPDVVMISPDHKVTGELDRAAYSANYVQLANYLDGIHSAKGGGVGIAIIDSGIDTGHPNFKGFNSANSRIVYSQSFVSYESTPTDLYGHGTHVAGIAAGADNITSLSGKSLNHWFWGFAPDASIINLKVLDQTGAGTDSNVIAAINKAIALKNTYNIRVMNLSLGRAVTTSYKNDPLCQAVEAAWKAGIVVVVSSGNLGRNNSAKNNGYGTVTAPGNDPYVITVGAVNDKSDSDRTNDVIATYSSKGPTAIDHIVKPDLVAPGNRIISYQTSGGYLPNTYPGNKPLIDYYFSGTDTGLSSYFFTLSGTSMAAPVVAGIAAELIQKTPSITPDQVKARLMRTAWRRLRRAPPLYDPTTNTTYTSTRHLHGRRGMVDAWRLTNDTTAATGAAPSPSAYYDSVSKSAKLNLIRSAPQGSYGRQRDCLGQRHRLGARIRQPESCGVMGSVLRGNSTLQGFGIVWEALRLGHRGRPAGLGSRGRYRRRKLSFWEALQLYSHSLALRSRSILNATPVFFLRGRWMDIGRAAGALWVTVPTDHIGNRIC